VDDAGFNAANIGDDRAAFERRQHFLQYFPHLTQRRTEHDQVRVLDRPERIAGGMVHDAQSVAFGDAGAAADEAVHLLRQSPLFNGKTERAAQQTDAR